MDVPSEKLCSVCDQVLPASAFYANPTNRTGLQGKCKDCQKSYQIAWALQNKPRSRWLAARTRAKEKGVLFTLTLDWLENEMRNPNCYICGKRIDSTGGRGNSGVQDSSLTLDRVLPELGYTDTNVRLACGTCNRVKDCGTAAQHRMIADAIDTHIASRALPA